MKTKKWTSFAAAIAVLLLGSSCQDWGEMDPPAGNQVTPTLENVATFSFEEPELDPIVYKTYANADGQLPVVVEDDVKGNVLSLNNGYVTLNNPLNSVKVQKAVSMTFWMKQPVVANVDDEGNETVEPQDLTGALIAFENENATSRMFLTANGWIKYNGMDGEWEDNNPATYATGYIPAGDWHYVALIMRNDGYGLYVDGQQKVEKKVTDFDCSKMVQFLNNVSKMYIGSAETSKPWMIDDLKIYRNEITAKEIARPNIGGGGGSDEPEIDFSKWILLGNEDNTTGFWSVWSPYVNLVGDGTVHYEFYNFHGGKKDNWNNWGLVLTNGPERGDDANGYKEYLYLRADAYGWGTLYNDAQGMTHDFNWDTFMQVMDGAFVSMDIVRTGSNVTVTALITAEDGTKHNYSMKIEGVDSETLGTFLTCEGSHLYIDPESVFVGQTFNGNNTVGATDFSSPFWGAHSSLNSFKNPFTNWGMEFINHNNGAAANWNNWVLVCTNGTWIGEDGYAEKWVLRSDAYGWGASFDAGDQTIDAAYDWESYSADMNGCKVKLIFSYSANTLKMVCHQTTADGRKMPDYRFTCANLEAPIGLFLTVDASWLDITRIGYYPLASME